MLNRLKHIKNYLYYGIWFIWCLVFIPFIVTVALLVSGPSKIFFYKFVRIWAWGTILFTFSKIEVYGRKNIKRNKQYLFLSNHQAFIDIPILISALSPNDFVFLSKKSLFYWPFIGWAMIRAGYIPIKRESKRDSLNAIKKTIGKYRNGQSVLIFPEGTYFPPSSAGTYKGGFTRVLRETQADTVPITIIGSYEIFKGLRIYPTKVKVIIRKSITYDDIKNKTKSEIATHFREIIGGKFSMTGLEKSL